MSLSWNWYTPEQSVLLVHISHQWTQSDLKTYSKEIWPLIQKQPCIVDIILDMRSTDSISIQPVGDLMQLASERPANAGAFIYAVKSEASLALVRALQQTIRPSCPQFQMFGTQSLEGAMMIVNSLRTQEMYRVHQR